jgi:hypothetical protein
MVDTELTVSRRMADTLWVMLMHDALSFCALLLSGVAGALVADPFASAVRGAVRRNRSDD